MDEALRILMDRAHELKNDFQDMKEEIDNLRQAMIEAFIEIKKLKEAEK